MSWYFLGCLKACTVSVYGHTKAKYLNLYGQNSNPNPKKNIWDVDIKAQSFVEMMVE